MGPGSCSARTTVDVTGGTLAVTTAGGAVNLSGIVVERATAAPATGCRLVTGPETTNVKGSAIAPLTIAATDPDAGQTLTYAATGLPAGLSIAASTGAITGTPTTSGTSNVTVTVTDNGSPARTGPRPSPGPSTTRRPPARLPRHQPERRSGHGRRHRLRGENDRSERHRGPSKFCKQDRAADSGDGRGDGDDDPMLGVRHGRRRGAKVTTTVCHRAPMT